MTKEALKKNKGNADNLLIAVFASALAPLLSRLFNLLNGEGSYIWSTESILLIYLSSITGYILSTKLYSLIERSILGKKGLKLGNSDAVGIMVWMLPVVLALNTDNIIATILLIAFTLLAIIILVRDICIIYINLVTFLFIGGVTIGMIAIYTFFPFWEHYIILLFSVLLVATVWDVFAIIFDLCRNKNNKNRNKDT